MAKQKNLITSTVKIICSMVIAFGSLFATTACKNNQIHFTVNDTLADGQGKKATVILLGGQSNASGCSSDEYLQQNVSAEKYEEYQNGYDNVYINYFASDTNESKAFVKCGAKQGEGGGYFGPELGLAETLHEERPDELFFVIKYAWGGTNLYSQWLSPSSFGKTGTVYKAFAAYVQDSLDYLVSKNYDIAIEGMCWMQGESDAFSVKNATDYEKHLINFIKDVRKKFSKYAAKDGIAFIDAYIADNPMYWVFCDEVNASKDAVAKASSMNVLIDTISEGLTCANEPADTPDLAHYDSLSQLKLGNLFASHLLPFLG